MLPKNLTYDTHKETKIVKVKERNIFWLKPMSHVLGTVIKKTRRAQPGVQIAAGSTSCTYLPYCLPILVTVNWVFRVDSQSQHPTNIDYHSGKISFWVSELANRK